MEVKQIIVVRKDLNMQRGKEIAQGCHASLAIFFDMMRDQNDGNVANKVGETYHCKFEHNSEAMNIWMQEGFKKICLQISSEKDLLDIYNAAKEAGLPCSLIRDAGHTQFHGVPTYTTVGIGPAESSEIDKITKNLKLY